MHGYRWRPCALVWRMNVTTLRQSFPFFSHRTLAEVTETEALSAMYARANDYMTTGQKKRLQVLLSRVACPDAEPAPPPSRA